MTSLHCAQTKSHDVVLVLENRNKKTVICNPHTPWQKEKLSWKDGLEQCSSFNENQVICEDFFFNKTTTTEGNF